MTDHDAIARGHRALNELTEVNGAFEAVREAIVKALLSTSPTQADKILRLHMAAQNLDAIREALRNVIDSGAIAEHALGQAGITRPTY